MTRIGKTQPSSRYCSIWAGVRHLGIDPRDSNGQGGEPDHYHSLNRTTKVNPPRLRAETKTKAKWATKSDNVGSPRFGHALCRRQARAAKLRMLYIMEISMENQRIECGKELGRALITRRTR
jgi:hypothetical protein